MKMISHFSPSGQIKKNNWKEKKYKKGFKHNNKRIYENQECYFFFYLLYFVAFLRREKEDNFLTKTISISLKEFKKTMSKKKW